MLFNYTKMESRNKLTMCRLCLCENVCLINIFTLNDWQGYVAAEVITDLLQFQVSETDGYPHVVCSPCLTKLTDFKLFKEFCQKSKVMYDNMFVSSEVLEEIKKEMDIGEGGSGLEMCEQDPLREETCDPIIKPEELDIDSSVDGSDEPFEETNAEASFGSISLKEEVLSFNRNSQTQSLEQTGPYCTSLGAFDADSCTKTISTNDGSTFVESKSTFLSVEVGALSSGTMEGAAKAVIPPGERIYMATLYEQDMSIGKERDRDEDDEAGEGEGERETFPKKVVLEERERFECFHCGNLLKTKVSLIKHMVLHGYVKSYVCEVCGKGFQSNSDRIKHRRSHTSSKPYKCLECSKLFHKITALKRHLITHTGWKPYKCSECRKSFNENGNLKRHMRSHTGSKPYKCSECSKGFIENGQLKRHMRTHTGCKPYKCAECSKCFSRNDHLNVHMRSHSGCKPYKCPECNKCFSVKANLNVHMRSHSGSKPYKCAECSKCFTEKGSLNKHMRSHTGSKPYKSAE